MELFAKARQEAGVWEILVAVGLGDELEEFYFLSKVCHWGRP